MKGLFITLEGIEGAGKTTALSVLKDWFEAQGRVVCATREPGGTPLAEEIRTILKAPRSEPVVEHTELLLMFAARAQHVERIIRPALARGEVVLCDRFTDSSLAYQGYARGVALEKITQLADMVHPDCWPDRTFWLDLPVEQGLARAAGRGGFDRFEQEKIAFFKQVRAGFAAIAARQPQRIVRIDSSGTADTVARQLIESVSQW
ncbi:MAG TPA: dTMP kinase [Halothiobacillaceae bacterium]|nr:dTMP kinase [Halothiobacillaceae bacterium]